MIAFDLSLVLGIAFISALIGCMIGVGIMCLLQVAAKEEGFDD